MKTLLAILLFSNLLLANTTLDSLMLKVQEDQAAEILKNKQREEEFLANKDKQSSLLAKAKAELASLESKTKSLTVVFEKNEKKLTELEDKLKIASGTLGEMFGVVKQISGDLSSQLENSVVSAELKGRSEFITQLAARKELPTIDELKKLWLEILGEINESGKVTQFMSSVVMADGKTQDVSITRIGSFNLFTGDKYLVSQAETKQIVELARQPHGDATDLLEDFNSSKDEILPLAIDPSRGTLLSMLVNAPSFMERFHQGGLVGYVIVALLFLGIIIVIERLYSLNKEKKKLIEQLNSDQIIEGNALGEMMKVFKQYKDTDLETLELKLEESILKSTPKFEKGISTLKILAAVAPLLGLLGTVTGMIATFQSITLFGTGDPKLMAGGISSALITTVQGLICAIPMVLLHNFISGKSKEITHILDEQSAGLLAAKSEKGA